MADGTRERIVRLVIEVSQKGIDAVIAKFNELRASVAGVRKSNTDLVKSADATSKATKKQGDATEDLSKKQKKATEEVKKSTSALGGFVAKIGTALAFIARFAVAFAAIGAVREVTVGAYKASVEYEAALADLAAIAGISGDKVTSLGEAILEAAGKTKFFSSELAEASKELLRLGFTSEQAEKAILPIAQLAQATGEGLSATVQLVGKTINAYGLSADSAVEISNAFVGAINKTALSLEYLGTALQYVAPLAKTLGVSVSETTALLGILANNGFKASRAGTGLRQIFIELGAEGGSLVDILDDLSDSNISLADAVDLVGKRAAAQLLSLIANREEIERLTNIQSNYFAALEASIKQLSTEREEARLLAAAWDKTKISIGRLITFYRLRIQLAKIIDKDTAEEIIKNDALSTAINENNSSYEELVNQYRELKTAQDKIDWAEQVLGIKEVNAALREQADLIIQTPVGTTTPYGNQLAENDERVKLFLEELDLQSKNADEAERTAKYVDESTSAYDQRIDKLREAVRQGGFTKELEAEQLSIMEDISYEVEYRKGIIEGTIKPASVINQYETDDLETIKLQVASYEEKLNLLIEIQDVLNENTGTFSDIFGIEKALKEARDTGDIRAEKELQKEFDLQVKNLTALNQLEQYQAYARRRWAKENKKDKEEEIKSFNEILKLEEAILEAQRGRDTLLESKLTEELDKKLKILKDKGLLSAFRQYAATLIEIDVDSASRLKSYEALSDRLDGIGAAAKTGADGMEDFFMAIEQDIEDSAFIIGPGKAKELLDQLLVIWGDYLVKRSDAERKQEEKDEAERKKQQQKLEDAQKEQAIRSATEVANEANNAILNATLRRIELERQAVEERFDYEEKRIKVLQEEGIINATQYEKELERIKRQRIDKENELAKQEFKANKINTLAQIAIDTAAAVVAKLKTPFAQALIPLIIAQGVAQSAIVASQKFTPVKYEQGGIVDGKSHAQGGVPFSVQGRGGYEMEGGEFIVNKKATSLFRNQLEQMNAFGSTRYNSRMFADGGIVNPSGFDQRAIGLLEDIAANGSNPIRAYVSEQELVKKSNTRVDNDIRGSI